MEGGGGPGGGVALGGAGGGRHEDAAAAGGAADGGQMFTWEELKAYVGDVIAMYESMDREHKVLEMTRKLKDDIASLASHAEKDVRRLISDMQAKVVRAEGESSAAVPALEETRAALRALEGQKARLVEECQRMKAGKDASTASLQSLTQQIAAIRQAKATLNMDHGANVPRVKCVTAEPSSAAPLAEDGDALQYTIPSPHTTLRHGAAAMLPRRANNRMQAQPLAVRVHQQHPLGLRLGGRRGL